MINTETISDIKGNRLFWLGRYTERAYLNLHLLRKYYDRTIDGEGAEYDEYFEMLEIKADCESTSQRFLDQMYDKENATSVISDIERANDNAILLREEIMSESLSYIQLSRCLMERCASEKVSNITDLQPVTDYLLAFWGSVEERLANLSVINILYIGRLVENIDMYLRFEYPLSKVRPKFDMMQRFFLSNNTLFDNELMNQLNTNLTTEQYDINNPTFKYKLLGYINNATLL